MPMNISASTLLASTGISGESAAAPSDSSPADSGAGAFLRSLTQTAQSSSNGDSSSAATATQSQTPAPLPPKAAAPDQGASTTVRQGSATRNVRNNGADHAKSRGKNSDQASDASSETDATQKSADPSNGNTPDAQVAAAVQTAGQAIAQSDAVDQIDKTADTPATTATVTEATTTPPALAGVFAATISQPPAAQQNMAPKQGTSPPPPALADVLAGKTSRTPNTSSPDLTKGSSKDAQSLRGGKPAESTTVQNDASAAEVDKISANQLTAAPSPSQTQTSPSAAEVAAPPQQVSVTTNRAPSTPLPPATRETGPGAVTVTSQKPARAADVIESPDNAVPAGSSIQFSAADTESALQSSAAVRLTPSSSPPTDKSDRTASAPDDKNGPPTNPSSVVQSTAVPSSKNGSVAGAASIGTTDKNSGSTSVQQMVDRVSDTLRSGFDKGGDLRMRLEPPELGRVQIEVSTRDGGVVARLEVQSASAHQTLTDNISLLHDAITQTGASVNRIEVQIAPPARENPRGGDFNRNSNGQQDDSNYRGGQQKSGNQSGQQQQQRRSAAWKRAGAIDQLDIEV